MNTWPPSDMKWSYLFYILDNVLFVELSDGPKSVRVQMTKKDAQRFQKSLNSYVEDLNDN